MLTLYYKPTCPYSQHVLGEAESLGVTFNLKDISWDQELADELVVQGGKTQVPFLIDTERGVKMYESEAIVAHLQQYYSTSTEKTFGGLRVHKTEEICDTCQ
jgi:glutathione S-transferase